MHTQGFDRMAANAAMAGHHHLELVLLVVMRRGHPIRILFDQKGLFPWLPGLAGGNQVSDVAFKRVFAKVPAAGLGLLQGL